MTRTTMAAAAAAAVAAACLANQADGHTLQTCPFSRQYANSPALDVYPNGEEQTDPEFCPPCYNSGGEAGADNVRDRGIRLTDPEVLAAHGGGMVYPLPHGEIADNGNYLESDEIAVRHGICGDPSSGNEEGFNKFGTASSNWPIFHEFNAGESFKIDIFITAYHYGHYEFFICNTDELPEGADSVPTQECFNQYPLDRDPAHGAFSPIDPNFRGRYYMDPECTASETNHPNDSQYDDDAGWTARMHYLIPDDLTCDHCVLQAVYRTGHRCRHPGYAEFEGPEPFSTSDCAPNREDWINDGGSGVCGEPNTAYAEEFWHCTDLRIVGGAAPGPTPEETPTPDEGNPEETPAPESETPSPFSPESEPETPIPEETPAPESETPSPIFPESESENSSPEETPAPESETPSPFSPESEPETPTPEEIPAPESETPSPISPESESENSSPEETPAPESETPTPEETPTPDEGTPEPQPETPSPVSPEETPVEDTEEQNSLLCSDGTTGIESPNGACCVFECGQCGGPSCAALGESLNLGSGDCCDDMILELNFPCGELYDAPCVVQNIDVPPSTGDDDCMVVIIEAEDLELFGSWSTVQDSEASGGEYITWEGLSEGENNADYEEGNVITTTFNINTPGTYSFRFLMRQPSGVMSDRANDAWVYFPNADRFGPADSDEREYGTFVKVEGSANDGDFEYSGTAEEENRETSEIAVEFLEAGDYAMEISGRSHGFQLDQIILFGDTLDVDEAAAGCQ